MLASSQPEPEPESIREPEPEPEPVSLPVLEIVLVIVLALEPESARGTVVLPPRARACLDHRPPEAQRSSDDQMPRHHPDQRPRNRT